MVCPAVPVQIPPQGTALRTPFPGGRATGQDRMARPLAVFLCIMLLSIWTGDGAALQALQEPEGATPSARGRWVAQKVEDRETGRDAQFTLRMRLYDCRDRMRERSLSLLTLRAAEQGTDGDRTLIRMTYPNDVAGIGFLVWEHPEADDERFLYLPSLGRTRRIAVSEAQDSFVGSDFTYEDIGGREFAAYTYRLHADADPQPTWTAADGATYPVYRLESRSRDLSVRFPRIVSLVRRDNFVVVGAEVYNQRGDLQKRFDVKRLEQVDGYWTAFEMAMQDFLQETRTELVIEHAAYDTGISADAFTRRELERGRLP